MEWKALDQCGNSYSINSAPEETNIIESGDSPTLSKKLHIEGLNPTQSFTLQIVSVYKFHPVDWKTEIKAN